MTDAFDGAADNVERELAEQLRMDANGFVAGDQMDELIAQLNLAAAAVGAPWVFEKVPGGYRMHPELYRLLKDNPGLLDELR